MYVYIYIYIHIYKHPKRVISAKSPNRGRFEIEGGPDGGAATRAVSMFVAQVCGSASMASIAVLQLACFRKSLMANGRDAEIA